MDLLCLVCSGSFAGTDGPYRFVSNDQFAELLRSQVEDNLLDLLTNYIEVFASLTLLEVLTYAVDRGQIVGISLSHLFVQGLAGLTVILTTLAVAQNYIFNAQ